ncbi:MAG: hypothetical protein M3381_00885 [Actinomycetota bacterium]|nr:hypothetical protein [Actinomycetota bacterium]
MAERGRLLELARHHHALERYEASVPLILAQAEGITADASDGGMFFSTSLTRQANVVDTTQLVAIEAGLDALRKVYGTRVDQTQIVGFPARHGVLHGRELAYDTQVASAKCWTLLGGIVTWAQPLLAERSRVALEQLEQLTARSQDLDDVGRRVDTREFKPIKEALGYLESMAWGRYRNTGKFHPDRVALMGSSERFGVDDPHGCTMRTSVDDDCWWALRTTISGWTLGVGLKPAGNRMQQYRFAGDHHPEALFVGERLAPG